MGDAGNDGRMKVYVCHVNTNDKKSRTVQFLFFVWVAISQYRGSELLASLQGMWLGVLCPGGEKGSTVTFPCIKAVWERKKKLSQ